MSELVCVIPARAGSRRLPGKNTAAFHGRPLGDWTFAFATGLGVFDRIVLTTDDEPLAALMPLGIARLARPPALASDTATLLEVLRHVIADLPVDAGATVVLMPVTGPLRTRGDFQRALEAFERHGRRRTTVTVCRNPHPPHLLWTMGADDTLDPVLDRSALGTRKQSFPATYFWNDAFLIDTAAGFLDPVRDLYSRNPVGVEVPPERSVPIDHAFDLRLAEHLFDPAAFLKE